MATVTTNGRWGGYANLADYNRARLTQPKYRRRLSAAQRSIESLVADGWTLSRIAVGVGVVPSYVCSIRNGRHIPSRDVLRRLADLAAGGENPPAADATPQPEPPAGPVPTPAATEAPTVIAVYQAITAQLARLSDAERAVVLAAIRERP